ncbi:class I SAM-dependent methyltransferase [Gracilibacillus sp. S3-1-1]|uniref:Class I SAM-dependent methyltransferase n=1 Tax=Gracilibacillus pellucidus TaxID=3095368 RepID=A0ACC6M1I9_9BACI|nr:class I SAM-dependent methyltransferase [Gracilibacillus sp. S3-1-1]MDX8044805.1 class I SAM-dependent methyltransferase [Gracilibacillus sp. S3-1-1]
MMKAIIPFSHQLLEEVVLPGESVVDATCGNGNDTIMLSKLVSNTGRVYAFDIQKQAIEKTSARLAEQKIEHVELIHDGHEKVATYVKEETIAGGIFNLGYLPKGDHSIITTPDTTIKAIREMLPLLKKQGRIVLVIYHGHQGGKEEKDEVISLCEALDQKQYQVLQYQFINQVNNPPFIVAIEKLTQ